VLGPLVVGGVAMAGPEGVCPWQALRGRVTRHKQQQGRVRVADSKKLNQGPHGLRHLEETALVFWTALHGEPPATLGAWLQALGGDLPRLARCPWYVDLDLPLPLLADAGWLRLQGELVARALRKHDVQLADIALRAVDVEEWNALIADTDNKSRAHFAAYGDVLARVLARVPDGVQGHVVADRCGGRAHYAADLARLCPGATITVLREEAAVSTYRVERPGGAITVTFAERGEDRAFPTALASCFAKYLRELMVECINRWFCARVPGLQPTAGYHTDGHRFLAEVAPHLPVLSAPRERLVRVR
jgi:hypothetical protein